MFGEIRGAAVSAAVLLGAFAVSACTQPGDTSKQTYGEIVGMKLCRAGARYLPTEGKSLLSSLGVSTIGASALGCRYIGGQIGLALDEMDREKMNEAAQAALDTGKVQTWDNPETDTSGTAKIIKTGSAAKGGGDCKTVRNTLVLADGTRKQEDVTACKNTDGEWEPLEG